jgi:hypothetical protein
MVARCANCAEPIEVSSDGRLPPWCTRCGADLNKGATPIPASAARVPDWPTSSSVGIAPDLSRAATISPPRIAEPPPTEGFDESRLLAVHDFSLRGYLHKVGPGILIVVIFLALAGGAFALAIKRPGSGTVAPGLLMAGLAAAFLVYTFAGYGKCIRRVEIFAGGIRWHGPSGTGEAAWGSVEAVYRSEIVLNGFRTSELRLVGRGGREVTFDLTIERYRELAGLVQGCCDEAMRPRKREEAGACGAEFGPVLVGPAGVSIEGWLVPWESVVRYGISGGRLWFHFQGHGRKDVPLHTIPNYLVLLHLMGEFAPPVVREASGLPATAG